MTEKINDEKWLPFLESCADEADRIAMHYFNKKGYSIEHKSNDTPVTQADLEVETALRKAVAARYPDLGILGEEHGSCPLDAPFKFIVDPIDGTQNFIRGMSTWGCLMAIEIKGEIVAGYVSSPVLKQRWWAEKGQGAFYNGDKIQVSTIDDISKSQAFHGSLYGIEARGHTPTLLNLLSKTARQRGIGDFGIHMLVAMGCGEMGVDFNLAPWDIAPLGIIVEEAGGKVTTTKGETFNPYEGSILSSNGLYHDDIVRLLT